MTALGDPDYVDYGEQAIFVVSSKSKDEKDNLTVRVQRNVEDNSAYIIYDLMDDDMFIGRIKIRYGITTYHQNNPPKSQYQMTTMEEQHWDIDFAPTKTTGRFSRGHRWTPPNYWPQMGPIFQQWFERRDVTPTAKHLPTDFLQSIDLKPYNAFVANSGLLLHRSFNPATINYLSIK